TDTTSDKQTLRPRNHRFPKACPDASLLIRNSNSRARRTLANALRSREIQGHRRSLAFAGRPVAEVQTGDELGRTYQQRRTDRSPLRRRRWSEVRTRLGYG